MLARCLSAGLLAAQAGVDRLRRAPENPTSRRTHILTLLALLALLPGCSASTPFNPGQTLHVLIVPTSRLDWMRNAFIQDSQLLEPLLSAFRRLQPHVAVQITILSQEQVEERLRVSSGQGLAPDLLMVQSPRPSRCCGGASSIPSRAVIPPSPGC